MAYIIHYCDESNPNVIKEEIVLFDSPGAPSIEDIDEFRPLGYEKADVHDMGMDYFPGSLPTDRGLKPSF